MQVRSPVFVQHCVCIYVLCASRKSTQEGHEFKCIQFLHALLEFTAGFTTSYSDNTAVFMQLVMLKIRDLFGGVELEEVLAFKGAICCFIKTEIL